MERESRLEAFGLANEAALIQLADEVLSDFAVEVTRGPTVGLLMVRIEEPSERLPFNFTEVTVSEAEVAAGPHRGYAMLMGKSPERAVAGAILDAALEAEHRLSPRIEALLSTAVAAGDADWQRRWNTVAPTLVQFEDVT